MSGLAALDVTFAELGVPEPLVTALANAGITTPFPIQAATLPDALAGMDVLGRGRTGSGKTLAFSIPMVAGLADGYTSACRPRGLVLVPTRELASQVQAVLAAAGPGHGPDRGHHLRRHRAEPPGGGPASARGHRRRLPRAAGRPHRAGALPPGRCGDQRARRGRPHGRPRLPAGGAAAAGGHPAGGPADAVLRHSRQRRRCAGAALPE